MQIRLSVAAWLVLAILGAPFVAAQETASPANAQIEGTVRDAKGNPVALASVRLERRGNNNPVVQTTDAHGTFLFSQLASGTYSVKVQKAGFEDVTDNSLMLMPAQKKHCEFVLATANAVSQSSVGAIQLDDRPNFTVAGVTDSTGSGGHGSETRVRTGEVLAKETVNLESTGSKTPATSPAPESEAALHAELTRHPQSFEANHRLGEFYRDAGRCRDAIPPLEAAYQANPKDSSNALDLVLALKACGEFTRARDQVQRTLADQTGIRKQEEAGLRRTLGDLDEKLGDPLAAEEEYERAVALDPSEPNYFSWGGELFLHRAAAPAIEVFTRGARLHPDSARMLAGLGAALYSSGAVDDATRRLCQAADLEPSKSAPYLFLGRIQEAVSTPLPCAEDKLARFVHDQPENALANYYYALVLLRRNRGSGDSDSLQRAGALLEKAVALDPKLDAAYLQLGNLQVLQGEMAKAVVSYQKGIAANPVNSQTHYRLGLAYKRLGRVEEAQKEFDEYKRLDQTEAAAVERQRREMKQFVFNLRDQNGVPSESH